MSQLTPGKIPTILFESCDCVPFFRSLTTQSRSWSIFIPVPFANLQQSCYKKTCVLRAQASPAVCFAPARSRLRLTYTSSRWGARAKARGGGARAGGAMVARTAAAAAAAATATTAGPSMMNRRCFRCAQWCRGFYRCSLVSMPLRRHRRISTFPLTCLLCRREPGHLSRDCSEPRQEGGGGGGGGGGNCYNCGLVAATAVGVVRFMRAIFSLKTSHVLINVLREPGHLSRDCPAQ